MKMPLALSLVCSLALVGCSDSSTKSTSSESEKTTSGSPLTAPVDYLNTVTKAEQSAVKTVDVTSLNSALDMFNVSEGRYPKDLNELVEKKYFPKLPEVPAGMKLDYNPQTGKVKVVSQ